MDPLTIGLMAMSMGGSLMSALGTKKRKAIDPEFLKQTFGANAVNEELMNLFNRAINSTQGQQMMASAAEQGQQFQTDLARQAASAGLGAGGGASSGTDVFATAGAGQAGNNLQRGMRASLMQSMLPVAQQMVSDRMNAYMQGQQLAAAYPDIGTPWTALGQGMTGFANTAMMAQGGNAKKTDAGTTAATPAQPAAPATPNMNPGQLLRINPTQGMAPMAAEGSLLGPSMASVQGQVNRGVSASRFGRMPRMSRFASSMGNAVQFA